MSDKKYLILGGGGSFAITTAFYLLKHANPKKVISVGRNPLRAEPFSLNIDKQEKFEYHARHIWYERDLLIELIRKVWPDIIINFAAQGESSVSRQNSWRYFETNAVALSWLIEELMKEGWGGHFIQMSTPEVYGSKPHKMTEYASTKPTTPYAASKLAFDHYLQTTDIPYTILRPANCYNPGQLLHRLIPKVMLCGLTGKKLPLHGGGKSKRAYMHTRDLAKAIHLVAESKPSGKIYNVSPDGLFTIEAIVKKCAHVLEIDYKDLVEKAPGRNEDAVYWLDSSTIQEELGWQPEVGWEEGLTSMRDWGKKYLEQIRDLDPTYQFRA
jgi:dTDP-glucose 4,6-dehydratase